MSASYLTPFLLIAAAGASTVLAVRVVQRRLDAQREEIRRAVAEAFAADRSREMAEARAYWAELEAQEAADAVPPVVPAPGRYDELDQLDPQLSEALQEALDDLMRHGTGGGSALPADAPSSSVDVPPAADVPEARRRLNHPSNPDFVPNTPPAQWTDDRLAELAESRVSLRNVRPGPLGRLDVYVFEDDTTLCLAPGDARVTSKLIEAVRDGVPVCLLGGSVVSGSYTLTFSVGEDTAYVLADRVVASM